MSRKSTISDQDVIKAYYQASKDGHNLTQVAKALGMNYQNLYSRITKLKAGFQRQGTALPELVKNHAKKFTAPEHGDVPKPPPPVIGISAAEFVRVWQTSESREEVVQKTGLRWDLARSRAAKLLKKGVPLKTYPSNGSGSALNIAALIDLALSLAPQESNNGHETR